MQFAYKQVYNHNRRQFQGENTSQLAHGKRRSRITARRAHYRYGSRPYSIIRKGDFKLIKYWTGEYELFGLSKDLSENNDLASDMPGKVKELDSILMKRLAAGNAKLPRENHDYAPKSTGKK